MPAVTQADNTTGSTPCAGELAELLSHLACWPYLQTEREAQCVTVRVRGVFVGALNTRTSTLFVNVPPDMVRVLLDTHPQLVGTKDGVALRIIDTASVTAAEAPLRWRIELERFAHQLRAASP